MKPMKKQGKKIAALLSFSVAGLLVFVVFSHMRPMLPDPIDLIGRIFLAAVFLAASLAMRRSDRWKDCGSVSFAFFVALVAISIDLYLPSSAWVRAWLHVPLFTPLGIALDKLDSSLIIILTVLILTRLAGGSPGSVFVKRGNWRKGLVVGGIAFLVTMVGSYFMAQLFGATNLSLTRIIPWIPWIAVFIFGNAFNEELLFRGLFLDKMKPAVGPVLANLVLILPFVLHHTGVTYTNDTLMFLGYLIPLAFFWGRITQKTDSILGSVLFHAGTDISVVLVLFADL